MWRQKYHTFDYIFQYSTQQQKLAYYSINTTKSWKYLLPQLSCIHGYQHFKHNYVEIQAGSFKYLLNTCCRCLHHNLGSWGSSVLWNLLVAKAFRNTYCQISGVLKTKQRQKDGSFKDEVKISSVLTQNVLIWYEHKLQRSAVKHEYQQKMVKSDQHHQDMFVHGILIAYCQDDSKLMDRRTNKKTDDDRKYLYQCFSTVWPINIGK